jgi:hypothetical protein
LAVLCERDLFGLDLALLFLGENERDAGEGKQEDKKYLHGSDGNEPVDQLSTFLPRHAESRTSMTPAAVLESEIATEGAPAIVTSSACHGPSSDEMLGGRG